MNTGGHGNDALIILVPVGVMLVAVTVLFGGPAEAIDAINDIVREVVRAAANIISSLV
jgi:hypothetical protein